ncbi:Rv2175c family DNA-binding protein [Luteimicrobium subarcticum]|uniref:Uncharacterized protein n=1 Tax=Luteimicrobium subarcticum TaxID=620910 RepID=A0A2M8WRF9_9MICO|nr:Rv2175c family DNA-binding protein [Luteimicrobium subarcticum]PJI93498.1 hypothetical protein CLV34_2072 [Luteimicrobium subarcticum]
MSDTTPPDASATTGPTLDGLVTDWLTLPEVAERLDLDVMRVRQLVRERRVLAVPHGDRGVRQIPELLLLEGSPWEVIPALHGTVVLLDDAGLPDDEILEWLFTVEPALGVRPVDALRGGQRAAVRRIAQSLA